MYIGKWALQLLRSVELNISGFRYGGFAAIPVVLQGMYICQLSSHKKKNLSFENWLSVNSNIDTDFIIQRVTFELSVSPKWLYSVERED